MTFLSFFYDISRTTFQWQCKNIIARNTDESNYCRYPETCGNMCSKNTLQIVCFRAMKACNCANLPHSFLNWNVFLYVLHH